MPNSRSPRALTTLIGFAAITAAAGITLGLPQTTHADHDEMAMWIAPGTQISASVLAEARLLRDANAKSGWALEIKAHNSGKSTERCDVVAMVSESDGMPMARVAPPPRIVWQQRRTFTVEPGTEATQRVAVPIALGRKLDAQAPPPSTVAPPSKAAHPTEQAQQRSQEAGRQTQNRRDARSLAALTFASLSVRLRSAS